MLNGGGRMLMWIRIEVSEPRRFGVGGGGGTSVRMTINGRMIRIRIQ